MFHPIYSTLLGHPELVADHLANYGALIKAEALEAKRNVVKRAIAGAVAVVAGLLGLVFAGVAIMLGGVNGSFHWVLVLVPGLTLLVAAIAGSIAARPSTFHGFQDLQAQLSADMHAMHVAGARDGH
jgi:ABC-type polysaccharide/polyol phosphate export permease